MKIHHSYCVTVSVCGFHCRLIVSILLPGEGSRCDIVTYATSQLLASSSCGVRRYYSPSEAVQSVNHLRLSDDIAEMRTAIKLNDRQDAVRRHSFSP